jgi:hypothetical protein
MDCWLTALMYLLTEGIKKNENLEKIFEVRANATHDKLPPARAVVLGLFSFVAGVENLAEGARTGSRR